MPSSLSYLSITNHHYHHHLTSVTLTSNTIMRRQHLCEHGPDICFPTALGRQPTFSNSPISRFISFSHQLSMGIWRSFGGRMLFLMPTRYGLGKRHWEQKTSPAVDEFLPPYLSLSLHIILVNRHISTKTYTDSTKIKNLRHLAMMMMSMMSRMNTTAAQTGATIQSKSIPRRSKSVGTTTDNPWSITRGFE